MDEMILRVVSKHSQYCPYTGDKIKDLETKPVLHAFDLTDVGSDSISFIYEYNYEKYVIWSHVAALLAPLIKPLIIFSSSIPSFFDLNWDDRLMCLKLRFFEIWVIHASRLSNSDHGTITFSNGNYVSKQQLEIIYDVEFVDQLFNFTGFLKDLELSDSAMALFSAVILYSTDACGKKQPVILQKIQEKYKIYLSYQLHVHDKKPELFDILLSMLPELQELGQKHLNHVKKLSQDISPSADEPVLLAEVFDCAKEEDIKKILEDVDNV